MLSRGPRDELLGDVQLLRNLERHAAILLRRGFWAQARQTMSQSLPLAKANSPCGGANDNHAANLDEHFPAIEIINPQAIQVRVSQNAVNEKACGRGIGEIVQKFPEMPAQFDAVERSNDDNHQQIKRRRTNRILQRLLRGP